MCLVSNLCIRNVLHMDCLKWKTQRLTVNLSLELAFGETMPMSNRRNSSMKLHTAGVTRLEAYLNIVQYQTQDAKIQTWRSTKYRFLCLSRIFNPVLSGFKGPSCLGSERRSKVVCELPCISGYLHPVWELHQH